MLVAFRSIVVALKAIVLNCLSVAAAYGDPRAGLPARRRQGPARVHRHVRHLARDPAAAVRDPVRALDGLPRVHRQPDPRAVPARSDDGRGDLGRDQLDGGRRDQRRDRDGLRVRGLRDAVDAVLQAVRRRARGGDPDRRDDRPRRPAARDDEAARRAELVPPRVARVAPALRPRRARDRRRAGARAARAAREAEARRSAPPGSPASC